MSSGKMKEAKEMLKSNEQQAERNKSRRRSQWVSRMLIALMAAMLSLSADANASASPANASAAPMNSSAAPANESVAKPSTSAEASTAKSEELFKQVNLSPMKGVTVQHDQALKTLDSWARQTLNGITGRSSYRGHDALATLFDISFRPEVWRNRPIIRIKNAPLGIDISQMPGLPPEESKRIMDEGTVSLAFWRSQGTLMYLQKLQQSSMHKIDAINQVEGAAISLEQLLHAEPDLPSLALVPQIDRSQDRWLTLAEAVRLPEGDAFSPEKLQPVAHAWVEMLLAWRSGDVERVNSYAKQLGENLPLLNPDRYPSPLKRSAEVLYNRLYKMTLPGTALYFFAFVFFLMSARAGVRWPWVIAMLMFVAALIVHTAGVGIRWWLVQKSTESWFYAIPIKNQFEAVMMCVWLGAILTLILESGVAHWFVRKLTGIRWTLGLRGSVYGASGSFLGWLALLALFTVPYVLNISIGNEIGLVNGILMHWMLYVHVALAVASYALITMSALIGAWWMIRFLRDRVAARGLSPAGAMLDTLDRCNLVVLQLAFLVLGVAIILGAIWADFSWGRPWGWDPKETFALVTWICYLVILHVRLVAKTPSTRSWWTAILTVIGFFVMLFNWIGVNYFLVGLHSYA